MVLTPYAPSAQLYAEPTQNAVCVDEVLCGMAVAILADHGDWLQVRTAYQYEGYVRRRCLTRLVHPATAAPMTVTAAVVDVLAAPKVQATPVACLTRGCVAFLLDRQNDWAHIILADGRAGFVRAAFLRPQAAVLDLSAPLAGPNCAALRENLAAAAQTYLGTQYRWGGKTPLGIDCSGLCAMAYWLNGITIYRDARIMPGFPIKEIPPQAARKGDLLFFPGHVGMVLTPGIMIDSSEAGNGVTIGPVTRAIQAAGSVFAL